MEKEKIKRSEKKTAPAVRALRGAVGVMKTAVRYLTVGVKRAFSAPAAEKKRERRGKVSLALAGILAGTFAVSCTVALARFPLGVYPAGFALLSAVGGRGASLPLPVALPRRAGLLFRLTVLCGVLFSSFFMERHGIFYLLSYLILFLLRAYLTGGRLSDSILSRLTLGSAFAVGTGLLLAAREGFALSYVFAAVSMGILTPILTYLACGFYVFCASRTEADALPARRRVYLEAGVFTLLYLFLYALQEIRILNFSLAFLLAVCLALTVARMRGPLYGAAAGMIGGMACGAALSPVLAVAGFFAGLFFDYSVAAGVMLSFVAACGYSLISEGFSLFGEISADYLLAAVLFFPLLRLLPEKKEEKAPVEEEIVSRETVRCAKDTLKAMSDSFSSLSEVFYTVGDSMKPATLSEASRLVSDACSKVCSGCAHSARCWEERQSTTASSTAGATARLLQTGRVTREDFDEALSRRCDRLDRLTEEINRRYGERCGNYYKNNKTRLLAGEYSSVSRLLKSTAGSLASELEADPRLEARAKRVLERLELPFGKVCVFGRRRLRVDVFGVEPAAMALSSDHLREAFEEAFGCRFEAPRFLMPGDGVILRLKRKRSILLECAKSGSAKKGEAVSGDSVSFFETRQDYFYTLLCDGMGSGRDAAFTSRLSSLFIEKLMHCATPKNVTLEMLNAFLMSKTDETFTTVDLLEIDLLSGKANFIKAGAAPSFVLRGDRLHRIESRTPPAGILNRMCAEQTAFTLCAGDTVILLSDGAQDEEGREAWLSPLLAGSEKENAGELCRRLFRAAREAGGFRDDLSISVVKIMNNE